MADQDKPVALVTVFSDKALPRILDEIAAGSQPAAADWFVGTFGINKAVARKVAGIPGCRYAPVFAVQPKTSMHVRMQRRLSNEEASQIGDAAHAGEIPGSSANEVLPPRDRRVWGIELGRRFRDELRAARAKGIEIETWQFDEVLGECGRAGSSNPHREFLGGVLRGLAEGRPRLGDKKEKGFVWAAFTAIRDLPGLPIAGDLQGFWEDLDASARFLVGEEYPEFKGDPAVVARHFSNGHRALVRSGKIRRSLGNRYIVGLTPGWRPASTGLGGNVDGIPAADVTKWRRDFIDARITAQRASGFAQFNFVKENTGPKRVEDAVRSLRHACEHTVPGAPPPQPRAPAPTPSTDGAAGKPLKEGDRSGAVEALQRSLTLCAEPLFYPPLAADGVFGPATRYAFEAIGFALGLTVAALSRPEITVVAQRVFADPTTRDQGQLRRAAERAPKLHEQTVAFDGTPTFWGLAKPLLRARQHGWSGQLVSSDRRQGVAERYGKRSQARLFDCFNRFVALGQRCPADCGGNCNPANPPGASSHECLSDGRAFGDRPRGAQLPWWELGLDVSDHPGLLRALASLGYDARQTYPNSPKERHHINFNADPGPVLAETGPVAVRPAAARRPQPLTVPPGTRVLNGIDVSNHQPNVDWEQVKAAGITFAFTKVSEGLGTPDRVFGAGRWKAMRDAGLVRGVYHFARPQKGRDPKDEVREFLQLVEAAGGFEDGDLVPVLDLEAFGKAGKLTPKQTLEWASGFAEEVHARVGRRPIIYTGVFWREPMGNPPDNLQCPLWLAAFVKDPKPFVPTAWAQQSFAIWQHTETGRCAGVPGNVDLNRLPGGEAALSRLRF